MSSGGFLTRGSFSFNFFVLRKFPPAICLMAFLAFAAGNSFAQESALVEISGQVIQEETKEPLAGVSVQIKGTVAGTVTSSSGDFKLRTRLKFPFKLVFSSVGFQEQEFEVTGLGSKLSIALSTQTVLGKEVVVTASRVAESILKSPVAIEKLERNKIKISLPKK